MDHLGFIRDKLDIKILILFILDRLPGAVEPLMLSDLAMMLDGAFTWFDYTDCVAELLETGHIIQESDGRYSITEKGKRNVGYVGSSLPYSVRARAERLTAPVAAKMRRSSMIETVTEKEKNGACTVSLRLSDGVGEIIFMRLAMPDETVAEAVEKRFQENAEAIYNQIIQDLTGETPQ